jgi:hypothetical protein
MAKVYVSDKIPEWYLKIVREEREKRLDRLYEQIQKQKNSLATPRYCRVVLAPKKKWWQWWQ